MLRRSFGLFLVFILTMDVASQSANKPSAPPSPLTAERVLNAYEAAIGSKTAPPLKSYRLGYDIYDVFGRREPLLQIESNQLSDGRYATSEFSTTLRSRSGFDGHNYWYSGIPVGIVSIVEFNSLFGHKSGSERPFSYGIHFAPPSLKWRDNFKEFVVLGQSKVAGDRVIVLRGTMKSGLAVNLYFDSKTFLLRRADIPVKFKNVNRDERVTEVTRYFEKYRDFGGWQIPSLIREDQARGSVDYVLRTFEVNPSFDEHIFQQPK